VLFRRIAVRNFRKLVSPAVIDGLGRGVTIIAGDNEEGKSTLLLAIRTGLFERHNLGGKAVEAMQPFGSAVRPEIRLDFEIDGERYSITKGFAHRSSALLTTPNGRFEGPAAEERLAELLTFRVPQRGESRLDDRGILGLFWLEQGRVLEGLGFGEIGRSTLRSSLEKEVGDVLGGTRGYKLLESAKGKRDALLTATGRPRADLAAAIDEAERAEQQFAELEAERRAYDQEIDDLARARRELARIDTDRVIEEAREALATSEERVKSIEQLRQQDNAAAQAVALAEAQAENARDRCLQREALIDTLSDREEAFKAAQGTGIELEKVTENLLSQLNAARGTLAIAIEAKRAVEERVVLSQSWARAKALDEEIAELDRRLTEVEKLVGERTAARDRLVGIKIDKPAFERIQRLESKMREAQAALGAVATRVRFSPSGAQEVRKNDEEIRVGESIDVTEPAGFTLEGFGGVDIDPGASELAGRRLRFAEAKDGLSKALVAAGVKDLAHARDNLEERTEAETVTREVSRLIAVYAPEGVGALQEARKERSAERLRLDQEGDLLSAMDTDDLGSELRLSEVARAEEDAARNASETAEKGHQEHTTRVAVARQATEAAENAVTEAKSALETARAEASDADVRARSETTQRTVTDKKLSKRETENLLVAANPEEIELRRNRAAATLHSVEVEQRRLRDEVIGLEGRLAALGKNGIGELLEGAREQAAQVRSRRDRLEAEARAWDLLVQTLSSAERDAKEAFLEPVLRTVEPFLRLLFPGARLGLDQETLEITGVTRDGREEPYTALSIGTREQLCILVRLAFAVYLREKGYPAAVILDDALVYADDERFERMQLALRKAAETVQILILTCRPRDWRQFGAPIRRLAAATTAELEPA
jgi:uncharacterized protein YhaN